MPECGTYAGYQRHRLRGEPACQPCKDAAAAYQREHRKTDTLGVRGERAYGIARHRARKDLVDAFPAEFEAFFAARLEEARKEVGADV